jgi:hypothetical protein
MFWTRHGVMVTLASRSALTALNVRLFWLMKLQGCPD